jgi:DnaJ-class molecular chaperone
MNEVTEEEREANRTSENCDLCGGTGVCEYFCQTCRGTGLKDDGKGGWEDCPATYTGRCHH